MTNVTLYSNDTNTKLLLVYFYEKLQNKNKSTPSHVYYLKHFKNITKDILCLDQELRDAASLTEFMTFLSLGCGKFVVEDDDNFTYNIQVKLVPRDSIMVLQETYCTYSEVLYEVYIKYDHNESLENLVKKAKKYFTKALLEHYYIQNTSPIKKYIYNADKDYCCLMNFSHNRALDSLFLPKGEKEKLIDFVTDFFDPNTKADYIKYSIPYKCNILLYGIPGAGKTSTIVTIASKLKMNIGMIPISSKLDDSKLITALNSLKTVNCKIIVLEDIDCLFTDRKTHDAAKNNITLSGLLNCLDGLFRNDGIMVFATANSIDFVDEAFLRSGRIDYKLYFGYASEYQIKQCFEFYFGDQTAADQFIKHNKGKQFSVSTLQAFLFKFRRSKNILDHLEEFDKLLCVESQTCGNFGNLKNNQSALYS